MNQTIYEYNQKQDQNSRTICEMLANIIDASLSDASSKIWHGAPVWFIKDNPVVGYWVRKDNVQLLFWSGQSFDEPKLKPEGKFKAAELRIDSPDDISEDDLKRWLTKAETVQWDYKNIVKRKGKLERI